MSASAGPELELLLAHSSWVKALARRMVGEGAAEDLVQDAWVAALERPRGELRSLRGWFAGVLANLVRERRRAETRRRAREQRSAHDGRERTEPSVAESFEAAATGRELAGIVLALEEPYRTVMLLRYYEELPPRKIAERLNIPVRTVNSRLNRGVERLREQWRHRMGEPDGKSWTRSLLLLAGEFPAREAPVATAIPAAIPHAIPGAVLPLGVAIMNAKILLGSLVLGGGAMIWWLSSVRETGARQALPSTPAESKPLSALEVSEEELVSASPAALPEEQRILEPVEKAPPEQLAPEASAERLLRGRVVDADALSLPGVRVEYRGGGRVLHVESNSDGFFEFKVPLEAAELRAADPSFITVMKGRVDERTEVEPLLVVAPRVNLAGVVVDPAGMPLAGARVRYEHPPGFQTRFAAILDSTERAEWKTQSDANGGFELSPVPSITGAALVAELDGFKPWRGEIPWSDALDLVLTLAREDNTVPVVAGVVVDPQNRPVAGAWVSLGAKSTVTSSSGEFRLERDDALDSFTLMALKPGYRAARLVTASDREGKPSWPASVVLVLGGSPLSIAGRVIDGEGKPRDGMRLWLADPTPFGLLDEDMEGSVEHYLGAAERGEDPIGSAYFTSIEADHEGQFRFGGLLERDYTVCVMNPRTLEILKAGPFAAGGASVEIVFEDGELWKIDGRVVDRDGIGVADVEVELMGNTFGGMWSSSYSALSDAEGRFVFDEVGGKTLMIAVSADEIVPSWTPIEPPGKETLELEITVSRRFHFQVDLGPAPERADALNVLDGDGERMTLFLIDPSGSYRNPEFPIVEGRSVSLGVGDDAKTLVLLKAGIEVQRIPIKLQHGKLNVITP